MNSTTPTTCQICGRPIKSTTGVIAHHGYKRPGNGWQTASCMGARHLPYEQSCDLIPVAIKQVSEFITKTESAVEAFKVSPPDYLLHFPYKGAWQTSTPVQVERPADFKVDGYRTHRSGAYDTLFHDRQYELEQKIKFAKTDLAYLTERLTNWKPAQAA